MIAPGARRVPSGEVAVSVLSGLVRRAHTRLAVGISRTGMAAPHERMLRDRRAYRDRLTPGDS
jgi:hypothetical protein